MSKCAGSCCAVFYISKTAEEMKADADTIMDGAYIADMLIPLSGEETRDRVRRFGVGGSESNLAEDEYEGHRFTCRHWDEDTRLCTDYENRPEMCRDYPYHHECRHGCDYTSADETRAKWWGIKARRRLFSPNCLGMRELERDRRRR